MMKQPRRRVVAAACALAGALGALLVGVVPTAGADSGSEAVSIEETMRDGMWPWAEELRAKVDQQPDGPFFDAFPGEPVLLTATVKVPDNTRLTKAELFVQRRPGSSYDYEETGAFTRQELKQVDDSGADDTTELAAEVRWGLPGTYDFFVRVEASNGTSDDAWNFAVVGCYYTVGNAVRILLGLDQDFSKLLRCVERRPVRENHNNPPRR